MDFTLGTCRHELGCSTEADERRGADFLGGAEGAFTGGVRTTGVGDLKMRAAMREMSVRQHHRNDVGACFRTTASKFFAPCEIMWSSPSKR